MSEPGSATYPERLTLREAWDDLGWVYATFSSLVGGPSVLALLQMIFVEHRLVDALQWIVDGYNDITATLSAWIEPLFTPAIAWLNAMFDWRLELHAHWRPLLLLALIFVSGRARALWRATPVGAAAVGASMALGALLGAAVAGLAPLSGGWWAQGVAAAAPVAMTMLAMELSFLLTPPSPLAPATAMNRLKNFAGSFGVAAVISTLLFCAGAGVSFIPGLSAGAGLLTLGGSVLVIGAIILASAFGKASFSEEKDAQVLSARMGLIVIGGFLTAGLILGADWAIRLLS